MSEQKQIPPMAKKAPYSFTMHNTTINDEYAWLRDSGWPKKINNQEILSYLKEENQHYQNYMGSFEKEKDDFFKELKGRIKLSDQSTYQKKDDFYYYSRTEEDKDYPIYCRKHGSTDNPEEIILDVNKIAEGHEFISMGSISVSPDHKMISYSMDFTGSENYTIRVYDLEKKEFLDDVVDNTIGAIVWHETIPGFFYSPVDEKWRHDKIHFHTLGQKATQDKLVLHEKNPIYNVSVSKSSSKEYIFIHIGGHDSNEIYYISMSDHTLTPSLLVPRKEKIFSDVDHSEGYFYQSTNDNAKNFQILRTKSEGYNPEINWDIYIKERQNKYLSSFDITQKYLLLNYKINGLDEAVVYDVNSNKVQKIDFPESAYTAGIYSTNYEENDIRIGYSSFSRPSTTYSYSFTNNKLSIIKEQEIPSGFNGDEYTVERIFATNGDVKIPISLFYKTSLFKGDGSNPLYLYGYGSYGHSISPNFSISAISLVNRGFVYAVAHIRGGDDLGHEWYEAAKFLNKKNTFEDFIASSETLIKQKYTSKKNIVIAGGSAGGMLVGNVINQRPELYKAAIAHVPFVDVLNTMLDKNLPLTPGEYKEWGNPEDKVYFDYIKSYSPYDNIAEQHYPALLVTAGLSDPRVTYWEAAKWVAKLRDKKLDNNLLIFKTNMDFGHQGASGRFDTLKEVAEDLVFIMNVFKKTF